jgi:hypothetical protein
MKIIFLIVTFTFVLTGLACRNQSANLVNLSPAEVYKLQYEATRKKDVATIKQTVTKDSLEMMNDIAKKSGTTIEEIINKIPSEDSTPVFEFRNEKIDGDAASVEVKTSAKNIWSPVYFRKEEGVWKVDMTNIIPR